MAKFPDGDYALAAKLKLKQLKPKVEPPTTNPTITKPKIEVETENINQTVDLGRKPIQKITWEKDGSEMVLIPAGSFQMGDHFDEGRDDERPVHTVELDAFYMDVHEVTVGQFREFVNQSGYKYGGNWDSVAKYSPGDDYPMIYVDWNDATAYAKWAGKRLPTEAE